MNCPNCGEFNGCDDDECKCVYCEYVFGSGEYYEPDEDNQGTDEDKRLTQERRKAHN